MRIGHNAFGKVTEKSAAPAPVPSTATPTHASMRVQNAISIPNCCVRAANNGEYAKYTNTVIAVH